ncbi:MAG: fatty acid hydroxylase [Sphingomonas sp.]|nr:MAG: fatty acid hydroxylase [Sphingomonas sp.]
MTLRDLVVAYFQYYAIQAYLLLAAVSIGVAIWSPPTSLLGGIGPALFTIIAYPMIWYLLHRYVLHSQWMYKSPLTAKVWKRIHYDHHQDPNHLEVLFGALYTTLPTIALATIPVGWLMGGTGGAAIGFATGLIVTAAYEFFHCIQHLSYKPKHPLLVVMKKRHMEHHFHDEHGNFGITSFWPDRLFGTYYERDERPAKSETVFNLGYTDEVAKSFPWVSRMSGGVAKGHPRQRAAANVNEKSRQDAA